MSSRLLLGTGSRGYSAPLTLHGGEYNHASAGFRTFAASCTFAGFRTFVAPARRTSQAFPGGIGHRERFGPPSGFPRWDRTPGAFRASLRLSPVGSDTGNVSGLPQAFPGGIGHRERFGPPSGFPRWDRTPGTFRASLRLSPVGSDTGSVPPEPVFPSRRRLWRRFRPVAVARGSRSWRRAIP